MSRLNKVNILKLAKFLERLPQEKFDMFNYKTNEEADCLPPEEHSCGTVGCALGWAPTALRSADLHAYDNWDDYSAQVLGIYEAGEWGWCFDGDWKLVDNTPKGAALRLRYRVNNGVPDNYREQMDEDCLEVEYMFQEMING